MSIFYTRNLKANESALIDWIRRYQYDTSIKCLKMNRNTYNQIRAELTNQITISTDNIKDPKVFKAYLISLPIIFDDELDDYVITAENDLQTVQRNEVWNEKK